MNVEKEHERSTLMNYSKTNLVDHCMALERNNNLLRKRFEIQYQNCMNIVADMNVLNKEYQNRNMREEEVEE